MFGPVSARCVTYHQPDNWVSYNKARIGLRHFDYFGSFELFILNRFNLLCTRTKATEGANDHSSIAEYESVPNHQCFLVYVFSNIIPDRQMDKVTINDS